MYKRLVLCLLCCLLLCPSLPGRAGEIDRLTLLPVVETVRPGKGVTVAYYAPQEGTASLQVVDAYEQVVLMVDPAHETRAGYNEFIWNGTYEGVPLPEGSYLLTLRLGNETVSTPLHAGGYAPYLRDLECSQTVTPQQPLTVSFTASQGGVLSWGVYVADRYQPLGSMLVEAGAGSIRWDGLLEGQPLPDGAYAFALTLTDRTGFDSTEEHVTVQLAGFVASTPSPTPLPTATPSPSPSPTPSPSPSPSPEPTAKPFTPTYTSPYTSDTSVNYWTLPMDITDEAAVWEVLMQPITVVDGKEKNFVYLRAEPSEDAEPIGEVTCATQGVHVLEHLDNGWSRVEVYSSSFADSKIKAYAQFVTGYLPTEKLVVKEPATELGLVVDKLTQRLYVFKEGKLFSTLLCSTGLVNDKQPWNETMSGEFLLGSAVGAFPSGNMTCAMGIRFNNGDILHETPYIARADGSKNYGYTEPDLGTKASHGCIRVQRKRTPEGVNMGWLWNNRQRGIKLLIWEDWPGRQIPIPADDLPLYYNPRGGSYYHSQAQCYNYKGDGMTPFTYGELDTGDFAKLKRCDYCTPVLRRAEYEEINARYAALAQQTEEE